MLLKQSAKVLMLDRSSDFLTNSFKLNIGEALCNIWISLYILIFTHFFIRLKVKASLQNDETHCSSGNLVVKRSRKYQFGVIPDLLKYLCVFLLIFILHNCLRFQLRTVTDFDTDHTGSDYLI